MRVFIYAYEGTYSGLHGICSQCVTDVEDIQEANEYGCEMAEDVFYSYGLDEEYENDGDDEFDIEPELCWDVYKIRDDVTLSVHELDEISCKLGHELFVEEYCEKEPIE